MSDVLANSDTKKSVVWYTVLPFSMHFLRFANSILIARILEPGDFGVISIISILLFYSVTLTNFGMSNAIVQRQNVEKEHYGSLFIFNLLISIVFFALFQWTADDIADFYQTPVLSDALLVFSYILLSAVFLSVPTAYLRRQLQFKVLAIIEMVKVIFSMTLSLTLANLGYGVWSLIYTMLLAQVLGTVLTMYCSKIKLVVHCSRKAFGELFSFSVWSFLHQQIVMISDNIDKLILGKVLSINALGFFDKAVGFSKMPYEQLSTRLSVVAYSTFSKEQQDRQKLTYYFNRYFITNCVLCFPIFIGLNQVSFEFTSVLLGDKWLSMAPVLEVISIAFLVNSLLVITSSLNVTTGNIKLQVALRLVMLLALVLFLLSFAQDGLITVAWIILGFFVSLFIGSSIIANRVIPISFYKVLLLMKGPVIASIAMVITIQSIKIYCADFATWLTLTFCIIGGAIVYTLCLLIVPFKELGFIQNSAFNIVNRKLLTKQS